MTSPAATLRGWANTMHTNPEASAAHLAGADALDTLTKVRRTRALLNEFIELSIKAEQYEGTLPVDSPVTLAKSVVNHLNEALGDTK